MVRTKNRMTTRSQFLHTIAATAVTFWVLGCDGGKSQGPNLSGSVGGDMSAAPPGPFRISVAGPLQPPITAGGSGATVTGVYGGPFKEVTLADTSVGVETTAILYHKDIGSAQDRLYLVNRDGTGERPLISNLPLNQQPFLYNASYSPDSTRIVAVQQVTPNNFNTAEIVILNSDGSGLKRLTNNGEWDENPRWSPDGTKIVYTKLPGDPKNPNGKASIWVMNSDGTDQHPITDAVNGDSQADWSPDGKRLVFVSGRVGGTSHLFVMDADGSNQQQFTTGYDQGPSW